MREFCVRWVTTKTTLIKELSENNLNIYTCLNCSTYFPTVPNREADKIKYAQVNLIKQVFLR